ncbi:synaptotagmin-5 [Phtheirospermum japonicum]|uniref:Synaptotagmin-5 n=1 Tax=Phtheirospermum japonicum TaxID=374723 RepID=A0A830BQ94_9LAMI|nr:synaptotagmin-5 [Phtheirospermum japonicum]
MAEQTTEQTLAIYCRRKLLFFSIYCDSFTLLNCMLVEISNAFPLSANIVFLIIGLSAAEAIIKESVEPSLEEYRPPGITHSSSANCLLELWLLKSKSLKNGQITLDIDLRWGGDPNIVLAVQAAHVASIPIQLKDLQVFTIVRAIFQLADEIPCISAVVVALLAEPKPQIDYTLKAVGGSLTAIPGLSDMIDDTVTSIVADMLQWPHRIVVPIGGIPVDIRFKTKFAIKFVQFQFRWKMQAESQVKGLAMLGIPPRSLHIRPRLWHHEIGRTEITMSNSRELPNTIQ